MRLYRFALATTAMTFLLLLVGGTVNPTGSALACPDWPTCHGKLFAAMTTGVQYEQTHRLLATVVGLMTLALALWVGRARRAEWRLRSLGWLALGLVTLQGVLGGLTVLLKLPLLLSVGHLALSMAFFVVLVYLTYHLRRPAGQDEQAEEAPRPPIARGWVWTGAAAVYVQVLLGAFVRHSYAGRACNDDWLLCAGQLWPSWPPAQLQMVHRAVGLLVLGLVVAAAMAAARLALEGGRPLARMTALASPLLAVLQITMGVLLVRSSIGLWEAVAHTGVAALLLGTMALSAFALGPLRAAAPGRGTAAAPATALDDGGA